MASPRNDGFIVTDVKVDNSARLLVDDEVTISRLNGRHGGLYPASGLNASALYTPECPLFRASANHEQLEVVSGDDLCPDSNIEISM